MKRMALVVAVALSASGCFHGHVVSSARGGPTERDLGFSLLWGLTETRTVAVECKNGLASAGSYLPWWAFLLSGLTAGIVTPVVKEYSCNYEAPGQASAQ